MKKRTILIIIVMVLTLVSLSLAQLQQPLKQPQTPTPVAPSTPQQGALTKTPVKLQPFDVNKLQKLQRLPNRAAIINSLMVNPGAKGLIESAAKGARISPSQLLTKGTDGKAATGACILASQPLTAIPVTVSPIKCENIDYNNGIKFSPFLQAPICMDSEENKAMPLGIFTRIDGIFWSNFNQKFYDPNFRVDLFNNLSIHDLFQKNTLPLYDKYAQITLYVSFPTTAATYIVIFHMVPVYEGPKDFVKSVTLSQYRYEPDDKTGFTSKIEVTLLADGSGYAGIMVPKRKRLYIELIAEIEKFKCAHLFSGITIFRL